MNVSPFVKNYIDSSFEYIDYSGWKIPYIVSSVEEEYKFLNQAAAIIDRTHLGVIKVFGNDSIDLLERLSTNKLSDLENGSGIATILTSPNGKIVDLLRISHLKDSLLITVSSGDTNSVLEWIDKYTFDEDVHFIDISEKFSVIGVIGPNSNNFLEEWAECDLKLENFENICISKYDHDVVIARMDLLGSISFEVFFPNEIASIIYDSLVLSSDPTLVKVIGEKSFEIARIQSNIPKWGNEITNDYNPLEANLLEMISWTKGCYIGQEVVARLHNYQKVKRYLVSFSVPTSENILPGDKIVLNDQNRNISNKHHAGTITSAVSIPGTEKTFGMGYIRTNFINNSDDLCLLSGVSIDVDNSLLN